MGVYFQGGGHSIYGIAADHVLSIPIVLASSEFVTASPTQNPSLFFALRGGGGSTFRVVTSVTMKAYPDMPTTGLSFVFFPTDNSTASHDKLWAGVRVYFNYFSPFSDAGTYSCSWIFPGPVFFMQPFFAPNMTSLGTEALLSSWIADLAALGFQSNTTYNSYPTFLTGWEGSFPQELFGQFDFLGSRLFP